MRIDGIISRVLLLADTHSDCMENLVDILTRVIKRLKPERIFHLGDATEPWVVPWLIEFAPVDAILGDNDPPDLGLPRKKVVEIADRRLGLIHGDRPFLRELPSKIFNRVLGPYGHRWWNGFSSDLLTRFTDDDVDCIICGHLHHPFTERKNGVLLVNPGAVYVNGTGHHKGHPPSIGLLEISRQEIHPRILESSL